MRGHASRRTSRFIAAVAVGALGAAAIPASASADAADLALGGYVLQGAATGYIQGTDRMTVIAECSALSVAPVASTRVTCSAGPAYATIELPGQAAAIAATGSGATSGWSLCVTGTGRAVSGATSSRTLCSPAYQMTAVVAG